MTTQQNIISEGSGASYSYSNKVDSYRTPEEIIETHVEFNNGLSGEKKSALRHKKHGFRGYTLEELRYRRVVNRLKIDIAQERLRMTVSRQAKKEETTVAGVVSGFQNIMRYADIAMVAFGITRKVSSFFRKFSRR